MFTYRSSKKLPWMGCATGKGYLLFAKRKNKNRRRRAADQHRWAVVVVFLVRSIRVRY